MSPMPIWECQRCKATFPRKAEGPVETHTCHPEDTNRTGYALQVGFNLEPGDDLYVEPLPKDVCPRCKGKRNGPESEQPCDFHPWCCPKCDHGKNETRLEHEPGCATEAKRLCNCQPKEVVT